VNHLTAQSAKGLIVRCSGLGLLYLSSIVAAKILGAKGFGIYSTVLSLSPIWAIIAVGGVDTLATKVISINEAKPENIATEVAVTFAVGFLGIAIGLIAIGMFVIVATSLGVSDTWCKVAAYTMLMFPLTALIYMRQFMSLPMIGVAGAMFPEQIILPAILCTSMLVASAVSHIYVTTIILLHVSAAAIAWTIGMAQLWNKAALRRALHVPLTFGDVRLRLKRARPFLVAGLSSIIVTNAVTVLVSILLGFREAGIFYAAYRLAALPHIPLGVIDQVVMPSAARYHEKEEHSSLDRLARTGATLSFIMGASIALGIAILSKPLLGLFGREFYAGESVLLILLVGHTVEVFFGPKIGLMKMAGLERAYSRAMVVSAIVLPGAAYVAAHAAGIAGVAAVYSTLLISLMSALAWVLYSRTSAKSIPYPPHALLAYWRQRGWKGSSLSHKISVVRDLLIS
jgi:O-antigen/teichoic acid export membrane protein